MQLLGTLKQGTRIIDAQRLTDQTLQACCIRLLPGRGNNALHLVLVAAGHHRLAKQCLAGARRADNHLHLIGEMRHVVQLGKYRLAAGSKETKALWPSHERIMLQLVMQEKLLGVALLVRPHARLLLHLPTPANVEPRIC